MNKKVEDFIEEFTDNFSELFVESFIIRFTSEFKDENKLNYVGYATKILEKKINKIIDKRC